MSTIFTDINAAIEEAIYIKKTEFKHQKIVQKSNGTMIVTQCKGESKERIIRKMFTTRSIK
jgi:hypothetical protein